MRFPSGGASVCGPAGKQALFTPHHTTLAPDRFGHTDKVYAFNGKDSFIQINKPLGLRPTGLSISLWAYYNPVRFSNSWDHAIITQDGGDDDNGKRRYFQISTFDQSFTWHRFGTSPDATAQDMIEPKKWYHVAATFDGHDHKLYVDGKLEASEAGTLRTSDIEPIYIGKKGTDAANFYFDGLIGDVRIYRRALTAKEIDALYHAGGWPKK